MESFRIIHRKTMVRRANHFKSYCYRQRWKTLRKRHVSVYWNICVNNHMTSSTERLIDLVINCLVIHPHDFVQGIKKQTYSYFYRWFSTKKCEISINLIIASLLPQTSCTTLSSRKWVKGSNSVNYLKQEIFYHLITLKYSLSAR